METRRGPVLYFAKKKTVSPKGAPPRSACAVTPSQASLNSSGVTNFTNNNYPIPCLVPAELGPRHPPVHAVAPNQFAGAAATSSSSSRTTSPSRGRAAIRPTPTTSKSTPPRRPPPRRHRHGQEGLASRFAPGRSSRTNTVPASTCRPRPACTGGPGRMRSRRRRCRAGRSAPRGRPGPRDRECAGPVCDRAWFSFSTMFFADSE